MLDGEVPIRRKPRTHAAAGAGTEEWVQLATRVPKTLHRQLKVHCVLAEIPVMHFVVKALADKLKRDAKLRRG